MSHDDAQVLRCTGLVGVDSVAAVVRIQELLTISTGSLMTPILSMAPS